MRTQKEMLNLIKKYAVSQDDIQVVVMNGSRANPNATKDQFQD